MAALRSRANEVSDGAQNATISIETATGRVSVDTAIGNLRDLAFVCGKRALAPLHKAHWVDQPALLQDVAVPPVERALSGDFFCAPFGAGDGGDVAAHGWPANSPWDVIGTGPGSVTLHLRRDVMGARVTKTLRLAPDAPLLYQVHQITGGTGALSVAHHPMVPFRTIARFCCSAKRVALTPDTPLEPGRNALALSVRAGDITKMPGMDGADIDLTDLPIATAHEDFVTLIEAEGAALGWSAVVRKSEDDVVFVLKDPRTLPVTMLWHSNGGRDYAPWNGRHRNVLGIEDGCAAGSDGHAAALSQNRVSAEGVRSCLPLGDDETHRIAHVIGAIPRPADWARVIEIALHDDQLVLQGDDGTRVSLAFQTDFFKEIR